jgi:hypothetical protein
MMFRVLALVAFSLVSHACGVGNTVRNPFDGPAVAGSNATDNPIRIEVQNRNFNDVTVWTNRAGRRARLGRVTGKTDKTFTVGWNVAVPIQFEIDVTGGRACTTASVPVDRGAVVWVAIPTAVGNQPCRAGRR